MIAEAAVLAWAGDLRSCADDGRRRQLVTELTRARNELVDWLDRGWEWLERNEAAPDYLQREDRWIERLRVYERVDGALALAWSRQEGLL